MNVIWQKGNRGIMLLRLHSRLCSLWGNRRYSWKWEEETPNLW